MTTPNAYDSPAKGADSDLDSISNRTNADLDLYLATTEDDDRECRNVKKRKCIARYISGKERGHYSSSLTINKKILPAGQTELFAAHLSTEALDDRPLKWVVDDQVRWSIFGPSVYEEILLIIHSKHFLSLKYPPSCLLLLMGSTPKYAIPTRKTIIKRIVSTYASRLNDMKSRLHALDFKVSLTYDVWTSEFTSRQRDYVNAD
ncbi:hypothetical protein V1523DRAFT_399497 [Lipomyces doorenjongii]